MSKTGKKYSLANGFVNKTIMYDGHYSNTGWNSQFFLGDYMVFPENQNRPKVIKAHVIARAQGRFIIFTVIFQNKTLLNWSQKLMSRKLLLLLGMLSALSS